MSGMLFRLTFLVSIAVCVEARAAKYQIVDLGAGQVPVAINNTGVVAGNRTSPRIRANYLREGKWHNLSPQSEAYALNKRGDIVGTTAHGSVLTIWYPHKSPLTIDPPVQSAPASVQGINEGRTTVGYYLPSDFDNFHCFEWTPSSGSTDLGLMGSGSECEAYGINDAGQITGIAQNSDGDNDAFMWQYGVFVDLGTLPGASDSYGLAISRKGLVAGYAVLDGSHSRAFLWDGQMNDLDPSRHYVSSAALSVNDYGNAVGWGILTNDSVQIALRFTGAGPVPLESEVKMLGDWHLGSASSIEDDGTIVGWGSRSDGSEHGFMLIPQ